MRLPTPSSDGGPVVPRLVASWRGATAALRSRREAAALLRGGIFHYGAG
jgi:hypothetical protein